MKHIRILVVTTRVIILPTQRIPDREIPSTLPYICCLFHPPKMGPILMIPPKTGPYQFRNPGFKNHHKCPLYTGFTGVTVPETNIAPANRPSQKETNLPTIHFQVLWVCHPYPWSYPTLLVEGLLWSRIGSAKLKGLTGSLVVDLRSGLCKVAI